MPILFRHHQQKAAQIGTDIVTGTWKKKTIIADVVPGGGKTAMALILANKLLDAGIIDSVVWLSPTTALRTQISRESRDPKKAWCNPGKYILHPCENTTPLFPADCAGCGSSYQQVLHNPALYVDHMRRSRSLLVLDEMQCLADEDGRQFAERARQLHGLSSVTLGMSGSLWRHDNTPIPLVEYGEPNDDGVRSPIADIKYYLEDAIADRAIRPPQFVRVDAHTVWREGTDTIRAVLSDAATRNAHRARATFLETEGGWRALTELFIKDWKVYQNQVHPSRGLVICADRNSARRAHKALLNMGVDAVLAVGDEPAAHDVIRKFQVRGVGKVLVSVEMVACGFDAPDMTHLLFLAYHRSLPKTLQAFGRVWRWLASAPAEQTAWIYVPDDPAMRKIIEWIQDRTDIGLEERAKRDAPGPGGVDNPVIWFPESASLLGASFGNNEDDVSPELAADVQQIREEVSAARAIRPHVLADIAAAIRKPKTAPAAAAQEEDTHESLRARLSALTPKLDALMIKSGKLNPSGKPWEFGDTNREMGKWVSSATMAQLKSRISDVEQRMADVSRKHGT